MSDSLQDFTALVRKNLEKNGFPEKSVSFPLEKMYESASHRGFSFNKVRDELKGMQILSEIEGDRIIFTKEITQSNSSGFDMSNMAAMAQQMLSKMSPEQQKQVTDMIQNMSPDQMARIQEQWTQMPDSEKQKAMKDFSSKT